MKQRFQITGMDCADCARSIEKGVARLDGVQAARLNFTTGALRVEGSVASDRVIARVRELGYDATTADGRPPTADEGRQTTDPDHSQNMPAVGRRPSSVFLPTSGAAPTPAWPCWPRCSLSPA
jgi:Cd2+/Zn2+-exporting ATPase